MTNGDTIAAIATASGRGGIAVVRVSGPESLTIARQLTRESQGFEWNGLRVKKIYFPLGRSETDRQVSFIDEAVVLLFKGPHSYTGEDIVEFQCHGGTVTPRRVLEACFAAGARLARRGEFTQRAFLNGKIDYDQAESVLDLIDAKTERAADVALEGILGRKRREIKHLYDFALDLSANIEHALDIDEGELPKGFISDVVNRIKSLRSSIASVIRRREEGHLLRKGALVVLAGPPNAGKSSLMNALLEQNRAIVSEVPGTTRDTIEEAMNLEGWPIRLVDTAGLRTTSDSIEEEGVRRAEKLVTEADVVLGFGEREHFRCAEDRLIAISSKCDIVRGSGFNVSARTGEGIEELKREIAVRLERRVAAADASDISFDTSPLQKSLMTLDAINLSDSPDLVLAANGIRTVSEHIGSLIGAVYTDDLLDNLFSRFCVGK